jgi:hypothetical protein
MRRLAFSWNKRNHSSKVVCKPMGKLTDISGKAHCLAGCDNLQMNVSALSGSIKDKESLKKLGVRRICARYYPIRWQGTPFLPYLTLRHTA